MKIFVLIIKLCILILKNPFDQTEAGQIKQEKSFGEIFGQGWGDGAEENICRIDQIIHEETADQNQNGQQQIDQIFDEDLEVKDEESEEMSINSDQLEQLPKNVAKNCESFIILENKKKREIVEKFHKIKEKIKKRGKKYSTKEWAKIERKTAQKLDVNQRQIYKRKREIGMNINKYSDEEKRKILMRFDQIYGKLKMKLNEKLEGKREKCQKIIAKQLGIDIRSIYYWKKELKMGKTVKNQKNNEQKREIVEKFLELKKEFLKNGKHSRKEWKEFYAKIKYRTIERWTNKIGYNQSHLKGHKHYTIEEKMEMKKQYFELKTQNPKLTDGKIAEILNIPKRTLENYKSEFKRKSQDILKTE